VAGGEWRVPGWIRIKMKIKEFWNSENEP